jgi:ABC-type polysaccharide transport system, permease component
MKLQNIAVSNKRLNKNANAFTKGWNRFRGEAFYQCLAIMGLVFLAILCYFPMYGVTMAFQNFDPGKGFFHSQWVGLYHLKDLFSDSEFWHAAVNSVCLSILKFVANFISPLLFALLLNELRGRYFKKLVQTASYLPNFISWVIIASIVTVFLSAGSDGILNPFLLRLGIIKEAVPFLTYPQYFWIIGVIVDIWKYTGFNAIIYIAAISSVDHEVHEAAVVDGATRLQRVFAVTLPMIKDTVIVLLILGIGGIFTGGLSSSNFNQAYLLGNSLNRGSSDVLDTYVLRMGLQLGRYSFASAAGLIQSILSLIMILGANRFVKKVDGTAIF